MDIGTSLGQHDKQVNDTATIVDDESGFETAFEKEVHSGDTSVNSPSKENKETEVEPNIDNVTQDDGQSIEKEKNVVDVENINSDDIPMVQTFGEGVAKRLRSNKGKGVPSVSETPKGKSDTSVTDTPKTKTKSVCIGPKKGWSKVKVTAGRSKKMKVVSSSNSDFNVEEDVLNITPSISKKSAGKKIP